MGQQVGPTALMLHHAQGVMFIVTSEPATLTQRIITQHVKELHIYYGTGTPIFKRDHDSIIIHDIWWLDTEEYEAQVKQLKAAGQGT